MFECQSCGEKTANVASFPKVPGLWLLCADCISKVHTAFDELPQVETVFDGDFSTERRAIEIDKAERAERWEVFLETLEIEGRG